MIITKNNDSEPKPITSIYKLGKRWYRMLNECRFGMEAITHIAISQSARLKDGAMVLVRNRRTGAVDLVQHTATSVYTSRFITLECNTLKPKHYDVMGVVKTVYR